MKLKVSLWLLLASLCLLVMPTLWAADTTPPAGDTTTTAATNPATPAADLLTTLANSPDHKTLTALIKAAGLEDALKQPGPFTLFAPTDAAFAKVPQATRDALMKPENQAKLKALLLYHVVSGTNTEKDLRAMQNPTAVKTLNGANVIITHTRHTVKVNKAKITKADIMASNGVIQVIDHVLMLPTQ